MLSADSYPVRSGFVAVIPNADYYTPTGDRLDLVGVQPNVEVKSAQALQYVLDQLAKK
jgi:C-terminal processing protease CtpA/Prc